MLLVSFVGFDFGFSALSRQIGCEERLRNGLFCDEWDVKPCSAHLNADNGRFADTLPVLRGTCCPTCIHCLLLSSAVSVLVLLYCYFCASDFQSIFLYDNDALFRCTVHQPFEMFFFVIL